MKEKVLITGASGFLGYHIINAAFEANLDVYAAIRQNSNVKHLEHLPIKYIQLDYRNIDAMAQEIADKQGEKLKTIISRKRYAVQHLRTRLEFIYNDLLNY